jgi:hypothetical protein
MGPNSKRAQSAAASASKFTPSRARFSKPPPKKNAKGGKGGGGGGRGNGGRGGGSGGGGHKKGTTAATANVVQRIAGRQQQKKETRREVADSFENKEALDELTLSAATMEKITQLLTDLNVVGQKPGQETPDHDEADVVDDEENDTTTTPLAEEPADWSRDPIFLHLTQQLSFAPADAVRAAQHQTDATTNTTTMSAAATPADASRQNLLVAMDWLCLHLSEQALEKGFRRRPQQRPKQSPHKQQRQAVLLRPPSPTVAAPPADWLCLAWREERAARFLRFGFLLGEIMAAQKDGTALAKSEEDEEEAAAVQIRPIDNSPVLRKCLGMLERRVLGDAAPAVDANPSNDEEDDETWADREEEREALASIYDDRFEDIIDDCDGMDRYKIKLAPTGNLQAPADGSKCVLHIFLRRGYPTRQVPLFLFYNATFPAALLRQVNARLIHAVRDRVGGPVIFDAVTMLSAELPSMQEDFLLQQQRDNKLEEMKRPSQISRREEQQESVQYETVDTHDHVQPARAAPPRAVSTPGDSQPHFMDKLRTMQGQSNSAAKASGAYLLSAPKKSDNASGAEQESLPCPVVVPVGELAIAMEEVVEVQKNQPWLVSNEARVPGAASQPEELNRVQLDRQRHTSKQLRSELEQRWGSALEGANLSAPPARAFQKMLAQRERLPAYVMKDHIIATIAKNQITVIAGTYELYVCRLAQPLVTPTHAKFFRRTVPR